MHGLETQIAHLPNPRTDAEVPYYNAKHQRLLDLGLQPHSLDDSLIDRVIGLVERNKKRIRKELFAPRVDWRLGGPAEMRAPSSKRSLISPDFARRRR